MPLNILIIGGGICGLTTSIALRRSGHNVTVLEKSHSLDHEIGQGITLAPNGGRILRDLGLDFEKFKIADFNGANLVRADTLESVAPEKINEPVDGLSMKCAYRPDLYAGLLDLARGRGVRVESGCKIVGWREEGDGVVLEDGSVRTGDLIVAADGVRSEAARFILGEKCPEIESSGTIVYRFTVPTQKIRDDPETAFLLDAGDGMCSFNIALPRWLVRYYCRNNEICNFALYVLREHEAEGLRSSADREAMMEEMEGFHPALLKVASLANDVLPLWRCTTREPLPRLHKGRVVVIGDAAHPVMPHLGLGAISSIEDAGVLGALFEDFPENGNVQERLELFSEIRVSRVAVYKHWSDVPFFKDALVEKREEVERWMSREELPKSSDTLRDWWSKFDAVGNARQILHARQTRKPLNVTH